MPSIKAVDTVRTATAMAEADLEGLEGRWLDVPRLQERSSEVRSNYWCARAAAAMVYNYYCKASGKSGEYIGHDEGPAEAGANGVRLNLRYLGGSNKGKLAGLTSDGRCHPAGIFADAGWKSDSGELAGKDEVDPDDAEKIFARHLAQLRKNNPVVQYTLFTKHRGHTFVIGGYKRDSRRGELWLRIVDPCWPHEDLLGRGNYEMITRPVTPDQEFSEYWLKARRFLQMHPGRNQRLYAHGDSPLGHFFYALPARPVPDESELVHRIGRGLGETAGAKARTAAGTAPGAEKKSQAQAPPRSGIARLPYMLNGSNLVTAEALTALYHQTERGLGGFFPLGDSGLFHCGAHVTPSPGSQIFALADGEVVAARIGSAAGEHPWGDTGFVLLRHPLEGEKKIYSLYLHLRREPLHPDKTDAGWLKRLLVDAMQEKDAPRKPRWRVMQRQPTWKDADKGKFSPTSVQAKDALEPGVYEEDEELVVDCKRYVKLAGKWVRALGPDGDGGKVMELPPFSDFDLETAAMRDPHVRDLKDGKTAVFDDLKSEEGKSHKLAVEAGETVGRSGEYLGSPALHWSVFSKEAVFPSGSLPEEEFAENDPPKTSLLDLSSKEHGTKEHALALVEALDPKKKHIGNKELEWILEPGELRHFYRSPAECWRARYQAVKALADFKLDVEKLVQQDRYKSHSEAERKDFAKNAKAFLFWDDLGKAEDFPADGKAVFVHPVTALRMMAEARVGQDHGDAEPAPGANAQDRLHAGEDLVIVLRDAKGPLAAVEVTVKADGNVLAKGKTDSQGELLVKIEDVQGKDVEVSLDAKIVGDKGLLVQAANETAAPSSLMPGDAPGNQSFNGQETVPNPRLGLRMKLAQGALVKKYRAWNAATFEAERPGKLLEPGAIVTAERIVFRRDDGSWELISFLQGNEEIFAWSIEDGEEKLVPDLPGQKEPAVLASWSARIAHLRDHPILAGRVRNLADGSAVQARWFAILSMGSPDHDHEIGSDRCKVAAGGFALAFDPHLLTSDSGLLNAPRPVYAMLKVDDKEFSLRDQPITVYGESRFPDVTPRPAQARLGAAGAKELLAYFEIERDSATDHFTGWSEAEFPTRKLTQLSGAVAHRLAGDGQDAIWIAACSSSQHIALETEKDLSVRDAAAHHRAQLKARFPDAPEWLIAAESAWAWKADNGIETGICARDCETAVNALGRAAGCKEDVRQSNLASCRNGSLPQCAKAVQPGKLPIVKKDACPAEIASCGGAQHDKSHCYLHEPIAGVEAEERERWHVRLPMRAAGAGHPYLRSGKPNARVVLINPANGAAVVCSQEARGPHCTCEGNAPAPTAAVELDELKGKDALVAASYETIWKLGLSRTGGEAVVLLAFCDARTPLGPLGAEVAIKLKKSAAYAELMGDAAPIAPGTKVKSSSMSKAGYTLR